MKSKTLKNQTSIDRLIVFINAGGPEEHQYDELTSIWDSINDPQENSLQNALNRNRLASLFDSEFLSKTIQGFGFRKPHGYAGDFEIIDYIYQRKENTDKRFQKWDKYLHSQQACKAVINRKSYFIDLVKSKVAQADRPLRILNIASGPCRDVLEMFEQVSPAAIKMHCVEMDPNAIVYARGLLGNFSDSVDFTRESIFEYDTDNRFDLVWSAGLFDYFADEDFIGLLAKIFSFCATSGEMVIGNFSVSNPSRSYMELGTNWYLFYRTAEELKELAFKAGLKKENLEVKSEALGVNLFLHAKA